MALMQSREYHQKHKMLLIELLRNHLHKLRHLFNQLILHLKLLLRLVRIHERL